MSKFPYLLFRRRKWYSDLPIPIRVGGKTKYRRLRHALSTDFEIAKKKIRKMLDERDAKKLGDIPRQASWQLFKEEYLKISKAKAASTHRTELRGIKSLEHLYPITLISDVTPKLLQQAQAAWKTEERGIPVINRDLRTLKLMMRQAEQWKLVEVQNWSAVKRDREAKGRAEHLELEEFQKLLPFCKPRVWKTAALLGVLAGLRPGEKRALEIGDVDFKRGGLHINPKNKGHDTTTRKSLRYRWVPIPQELLSHLKTTKGQYILESKPTAGGMCKMFRDFFREAGLKGSEYTLRHTYASWLLAKRVPIKTVAELMGHTTTEITEIYGHLLSGEREKAIQALPWVQERVQGGRLLNPFHPLSKNGHSHRGKALRTELSTEKETPR